METMRDARDMKRFFKGVCETRMTFSFEWMDYSSDDGGVCETRTLPLRRVLCPACEGAGTVHRAATVDHWYDDDFWHDDEGSGVDVACETCGGLRVVLTIARDTADPATLAVWDKVRGLNPQRWDAAERRMGA